jgi:predicted NUDIX family NTP pyrophosphohydrolase
LLVHPGGPYFAKKDDGAWSLPKGLVDEGEDALTAARRELREETGLEPPAEGYVDLGEVVQKAGKRVRAFAFAGDCDPAACRSGTFSMEWPPRSGRRVDFPEVDRAAFFDLDEAARKILPAQAPFLERARASRDALFPPRAP